MRERDSKLLSGNALPTGAGSAAYTVLPPRPSGGARRAPGADVEEHRPHSPA